MAAGGATSPDDMQVSRDGTEDRPVGQQNGNGDQLQEDDETGSAKGKSVIIVREKAKRGARAVSHLLLPLDTRAPIDAPPWFAAAAAAAKRSAFPVEN